MTDKTAKEIEELFGELCKAIPPRKIGDFLYHMNEIGLWIAAQRRKESHGTDTKKS